MERYVLENQLSELATDCEELVEVLRQEREAMRAWNFRAIQDFGQEKELLVAAIEQANSGIRDGLEELATHHSCSAAMLLAQPDSYALRRFKTQIEVLGEEIRRQGSLNRQVAEHATQFLKRFHGDEETLRPLTYGPMLSAYGAPVPTYVM